MSSRILSAIVGIGGLIVSIWLGMSLAQADWLNLVIFIAIILSILFVSGGYRFTFFLTVFLISLGGRFYAGFAISRDEQFLLLSGALVAATFWRQRTAGATLPSQYNTLSFSATKALLVAWIFYVVVHIAIHLALFRTEGLQNIIKSYNSTLTPYIFFLYFLTRPEMFPIPRGYFKLFSWILAIVTAVSVFMRMYQTYFGAPAEVENPDDIGLAGPLTIAFFSENQYTLRGLVPIAVVLGTIILTSYANSLRSGFWRFFGCCLIGVSIIGGFFSGGRASLIIAIAASLFVLVVRKRRGPLALATVMGILLIVAANLFSGWINTHAPGSIARSAQLILVEKDIKSSATISGSSEWRWNLAMYALNEWKKDAKTIFLGLGFQGISASDIAAAGTYFGKTNEFIWEIGVKRVATHNMITDLLVAYGLVGAIIYYLMLITLNVFAYRMYRLCPSHSQHKDFALFAFTCLLISSTLGNISGTFLPVNLILFLIILVSAVTQHQDNFENISIPNRIANRY